MIIFFRKSICVIFSLLLLCCLSSQSAFADEAFPLSYEQIKQTAASGDPDSEYALGYMLYYGKSGVKKDPVEARKWIERAAKHHQPQAIRALQLMGMRQPSANEETVADNTPPNTMPTNTMPKKPVANNETFVDMTKREKDKSPQPASNLSDNGYTIQLLAAADQNKANKVLQEYHLEDQGKIYHTRQDTKEWYILVYGTYTTKAEAKIAAAQLKKKTHLDPWVKPYSQIKKVLAKN